MFRQSYGKIEEFEVVKTTASSVVFINLRGKKEMERLYSSYHSWHCVKKDAFDAIILQLKNKINGHYEQITIYERKKDELSKMYPEFTVK